MIGLISCNKEVVTPPKNSPTKWNYSAVVPVGFDIPGQIVGGEPFFVIFNQDHQKLYLVWTKNGVPGSDTQGKMYYSTQSTLAQESSNATLVGTTQSQIDAKFSSGSQYVVVSHFIDNPMYESWKIENY